MNIFEIFKAQWVEEDLDVHAGADEQSIIDCFSQFGVIPKDDLLALYKIMNGKDCMDEQGFRLWSLDEVIEENNKEREIDRTNKYGVLFADYLLNCWVYRVNRNGEVVLDHNDDSLLEVKGSSMLTFFELMKSDPDEALL